MDAAGVEKAALLGMSEGGPLPPHRPFAVDHLEGEEGRSDDLSVEDQQVQSRGPVVLVHVQRHGIEGQDPDLVVISFLAVATASSVFIPRNSGGVTGRRRVIVLRARRGGVAAAGLTRRRCHKSTTVNGADSADSAALATWTVRPMKEINLTDQGRPARQTRLEA